MGNCMSLAGRESPLAAPAYGCPAGSSARPAQSVIQFLHKLFGALQGVLGTESMKGNILKEVRLQRLQ